MDDSFCNFPFFRLTFPNSNGKLKNRIVMTSRYVYYKLANAISWITLKPFWTDTSKLPDGKSLQWKIFLNIFGNTQRDCGYYFQIPFTFLYSFHTKGMGLTEKEKWNYIFLRIFDNISYTFAKYPQKNLLCLVLLGLKLERVTQWENASTLNNKAQSWLWAAK